ncbi:hypothetical protein AB6G07_10150 [Providencia stuartii]|uniref:hypothetical protein n=1 Tax=Providencia stuartii TaxID=588 RepID=UPI0034DCEBE2
MKQTLIFLLLTVLACGSRIGHMAANLEEAIFLSVIEVITLTPAMPVPGAVNNGPATKGYADLACA